MSTTFSIKFLAGTTFLFIDFLLSPKLSMIWLLLGAMALDFATGVAKTANYTATISDQTINFTSGTDTLTLPTAVGITGRIYTITNSGTLDGMIYTTSSQTFTNYPATPTTLALPAKSTRVVQSTGANWVLVSVFN